MKIFFACSRQVKDPNYRLIIDTLRELGHEVLENQFSELVENTSITHSPSSVLDRDEKALREADIFIGDGTKPSFTAGYYFALASMQKKPALMLYNKNVYNKAEHSSLTKASSSNLISIEYYDKENLKFLLKKHLSAKTKEIFSTTKFNFIISPYIADYLDWVAHVKKQSKSDFLRDVVIKKIIENDQEFQEYLFKRKNKK